MNQESTVDEAVRSRLELAVAISKSGGKSTLEYFQTDRFSVERKGDGSPLTIADRQAEKHLRAEIEAAFPDDGIIGEEFGEKGGANNVRWVLDPIDGTKSFISGVPLYGTMVGIEIDGEATVGAVYLPGLDEGIYASAGNGAWHYRGDSEPMKAQVSDRDQLSECVMVTSETETFGERNANEVYAALVDRMFISRTWGDVYGYLLVATGRVDLMIDPILNVWDAAAVKPIIEESGGKFSDWAGVSRVDGGEAFGCNPHIYEQVLEITKPFAGKF